MAQISGEDSQFIEQILSLMVDVILQEFCAAKNQGKMYLKLYA